MSQAGYRVSKHYSEFPVGRAVLVILRAQTHDRGRVGYLDLEDLEVRLRFAPFPIVTPTEFDADLEMEKLADKGRAMVNVILPTARPRLHVEWVAIEADVEDASTPSGRKEHALDLPWLARAIATPAPA